MENLTLPAAKFGMTSTNYRLPPVPDSLPQYDVLKAANALNAYRYEKLTHRQRIFVDCYLSNDFDAPAAAIEARFTIDPEEAKKIGASLLRKDVIKQAIHLALCYFTEHKKFRFDPDVYLRRLHAIATADPDDYYGHNGQVSLPGCPVKRSAVKKIKTKNRTTGRGKEQETIEETELELYSAMDAIKMLFVLCDPVRAAGDGKVAGAVADGGALATGGSVMFEIIAVPSGEFIPAPQPPVRTIEHA